MHREVLVVRLDVVNELLRDRRGARAGSPPQVDRTFKRAEQASESILRPMNGPSAATTATEAMTNRSSVFSWISERNLRGAPIDYPRPRGMYVPTTTR